MTEYKCFCKICGGEIDLVGEIWNENWVHIGPQRGEFHAAVLDENTS